MSNYSLNDSMVEPLARPNKQGYWWWLPKCFIDEGKTSREYWSVEYEGPDTTKVGLFIGPLNPPLVKDLPQPTEVLV